MLFYRLNVIALRIPPLRERREDIPHLVAHFAAKHSHGKGSARATRGALARMEDYVWPGNVRELENEIERVLVLGGGSMRIIGEEMLSTRVRGAKAADRHRDADLRDAVASYERGMIEAALTRERGNRTRAAEVLGISRRNLIRKVQEYGLK